MPSALPASVPLMPSGANSTLPFSPRPAQIARSGSRNSRKSGSAQIGRKRRLCKAWLAVYQALGSGKPLQIRALDHWHTSHCPRAARICHVRPASRRSCSKSTTNEPFSMRNFHFAGRSTVHAHERHGGDVASAGRADRDRGAARRRHGGRRRGGGLRAARRDRAAIDRHRRRLFRADPAEGRGQDHGL